eukprot:5089761-Amphidinium_carterae.1
MQSLDGLVSQAKWLQREFVRAHGCSNSKLFLQGKTLDLEHAFRQLAVSPACKRAACIAVWSPERKE